jgi:hypothetical protein
MRFSNRSKTGAPAADHNPHEPCRLSRRRITMPHCELCSTRGKEFRRLVASSWSVENLPAASSAVTCVPRQSSDSYRRVGVTNERRKSGRSGRLGLHLRSSETGA